MSISDVTSRFRRPEYTGDNRCLPCTVVNAGIAAVLAGALALVSPPLGLLAFAGALATIYLRGYLVPGTPSLTEQYLPPTVLRLFGKEAAGPTVRADATEREDALDLLYAADVVAGEGGGADLAPSFRRAWRDRIVARASGEVEAEEVAALYGAETVDRQSERSFVVDGAKMARWESTGALAADVAADAELRERIAGWETLDRETRADVLTALRLQLETCPDCRGSVEVAVETDDRCCQKPLTAFDAVCRDCGEPVASATITGIDDDPRPPALRFLDA